MQPLTFGHGTAGEIDLAALMRRPGVTVVVDVRNVRAYPHVVEALSPPAHRQCGNVAAGH